MRQLSSVRACLAGLGLAWAALSAIPVNAETLEELDALSDAATDEATGLSVAREQAGRGEYLEALATLERVLAVHPQSREARLIHAIYLCEIDDRRGGLVEIDKLKEKHYGKELLAQARARCAGGAGG